KCGAGTRQFENAAAADTVSNGRDAIRIAFRPLLKDFQTGRKPAAKSQPIFDEWPDNCHRWLWRTWPYTSSEQVGNESGVAQFRQSIGAPTNRLVDVQPAGHNQYARQVARRLRCG